MTRTPSKAIPPPEASTYEIRLLGHLDLRWLDELAAQDLVHDGGGITRLRLLVADQAALHGLLQRIRDLGLVLISVTRIEPAASIGAPK